MSDASRAAPPRGGNSWVESWRASRTIGGSWTVGGRLTLTATELWFEPHRFNLGLGKGRSYSVPLTAVRAVSVAPRGLHPWNGSLRRRLQVDTESASDFFVVAHVDDVVESISRARRAILAR